LTTRGHYRVTVSITPTAASKAAVMRRWVPTQKCRDDACKAGAALSHLTLLLFTPVLWQRAKKKTAEVSPIAPTNLP